MHQATEMDVQRMIAECSGGGRGEERGTFIDEISKISSQDLKRRVIKRC